MGLLEDSCIGWWKFNGNALAEIGLPGIWTGSELYQAVKFANGIEVDDSGPAANFVVAPDNSTFDPNDFALEIYLKPDWPVTNGASGLAQQGYFGWFKNSNNVIIMDTIAGSTRFLIRINGVFTIYTITTGYTWLANSVNYLLIAFKRTGIDGGATIMELRLNGVPLFSSVVAPLNQSLNNGDYYFGTFLTTGIAKGFDGGIDNFRFYGGVTGNLLTLIEGNKENEGFPVSGRPIANKYNFERYRGAA